MPPSPMNPENAFKNFFSTNKGYITESDLASTVVQFSPEGVCLSQKHAQSGAKDVFATRRVLLL